MPSRTRGPPIVRYALGALLLLGIMNRYFSREVRVEVHTEHGALLSEAFASETDLGSGSTRPLPLAECSGRRAVVVFPDCPARTLVRIHWPMDTR